MYNLTLHMGHKKQSSSTPIKAGTDLNKMSKSDYIEFPNSVDFPLVALDKKKSQLHEKTSCRCSNKITAD